MYKWEHEFTYLLPVGLCEKKICSIRDVQTRAECYIPMEISRSPNYFHSESNSISKFLFFLMERYNLKYISVHTYTSM